MSIAVCILAQVPQEIQSLPETIASLRRIGEVTVYDSSGSDGIKEIAAEAGVSWVPLAWHDNAAESFNTVHSLQSTSHSLLVHADEVVEDADGFAAALQDGLPGVVRIRHRITERQSYIEAHEVRLLPRGDTYTFVGNYSPDLYCHGEIVQPVHVPQLPLVLAHFPVRWPKLPDQRIAMIIRAIEKSLLEEPMNERHLYALLYRCWTINDWPRVRQLAHLWREAADACDKKHALVDYYEACAATVSRDLQLAEQRLRSALAHEERFADAWYLLGKLRQAQKDRTSAQDAFLRASACGLQAEPVAVEDYSLSTWRPLQELAKMAQAAGRTEDAAFYRRRAEAVQAQLLHG